MAALLSSFFSVIRFMSFALERFINCTSKQLKKAMSRAVAFGNRVAEGWWPYRLPEQTKVIKRWGKTPEGWKQWYDPPPPHTYNIRSNLFLLAWWTDLLGRKHTAVLAYPPVLIDTELPNIYFSEEEPPSPLWMVYPEHCFLVAQKKRNALKVICRCGAIGSQEELGWMGDCCGPCHDRAQGADDSPMLSATVNEVFAIAPSFFLQSVAWSSDSRFLALKAPDQAQVWDCQNRSFSFVRKWAPEVVDIAFVPNEPVLLVSNGNQLHEWDLESDECVEKGSGQYLFDITCSSDGDYVAARDWIGASYNPDDRSTTLEIWRRQKGSHFEKRGEGSTDYSLAGFAPRAGELIRARPNGLVQFRALPQDRTVGRHQILPEAEPLQMAFSPDERLMAMLFDCSGQPFQQGGEMLVFDLNTRQLVHRWRAHGSRFGSLTFSPDGRYLLSTRDGNRTDFYEVETGQIFLSITLPGRNFSRLITSPDGSSLAVQWDGRGELWSWQSVIQGLNLEE